MSYQTATVSLSIAGLPVKITHITNLEELLDALIAKGEDHEDNVDERIPYWADLWHSAIALSEYLVEKKVVTAAIKTTELGCGLGLPGIVAGLLGADCTLTDYMQEPLDFLTTNWQQNLDKPLKCGILDWRQPDQRYQADLLLASDVAYEQRSFAYLKKTLPLLVKPKGRIILTEPTRYIAKGFIADITNDPNYEVSLLQKKIDWDGFEKPVNILDIRLR